jgi:hypothetical protein
MMTVLESLARDFLFFFSDTHNTHIRILIAVGTLYYMFIQVYDNHFGIPLIPLFKNQQIFL